MNTTDTLELPTVDRQTGTIIRLPLGLLGFETIKRYVLLAPPEDAPFQWLQVLEDNSLAFLVLSPFEIMADYQMELTDEDAAFLNLASPADSLVYNIVTLRRGGQATINLKGPIVLNKHTLIGKQVVLLNAGQYSIQHPLPATGQ